MGWREGVKVGGREGVQFGREGARWIQENPNSAAPKMASVVIEFIPLDSRTVFDMPVFYDGRISERNVNEEYIFIRAVWRIYM